MKVEKDNMPRKTVADVQKEVTDLKEMHEKLDAQMQHLNDMLTTISGTSQPVVNTPPPIIINECTGIRSKTAIWALWVVLVGTIVSMVIL